MKCVSCNRVTEELLVTNEECPFYFTKSDLGVKCPHCSIYICGSCIMGFLERGCHKFVDDDRWSYDMSYFHQWGILPAKDFRCHACEWSHEKDNARIDQKKYLEQCKEYLPFLGMLCFYEFGILVTAPLDQLLDVHACAKYKTDKFGEFGAWHCVIDINLAQEMRKQGIEADGKIVDILQKNVVKCFCQGYPPIPQCVHL